MLSTAHIVDMFSTIVIDDIATDTELVGLFKLDS